MGFCSRVVWALIYLPCRARHLLSKGFSQFRLLSRMRGLIDMGLICLVGCPEGGAY